MTGLTIFINCNDLGRVEATVRPTGKNLVIHMKPLKKEEKKR